MSSRGSIISYKELYAIETGPWNRSYVIVSVQRVAGNATIRGARHTLRNPRLSSHFPTNLAKDNCILLLKE